MAQMGIGPRIAGLLLLILLLAGAGIWWFNYLGLFQAGQFFAPILGIFGGQPETLDAEDPLLLDTIRLRRQEEALEIRVAELDKQEGLAKSSEEDFEQRLAELEERQRAQDERERAFQDQVNRYGDRERNLRLNVQLLNSMPPKQAVAILDSYEDQLLIDTFRMAETMATEEGKVSLVSVWMGQLSDLEAQKIAQGKSTVNRMAEIQRKMTLKPTNQVEQ